MPIPVPYLKIYVIGDQRLRSRFFEALNMGNRDFNSLEMQVKIGDKEEEINLVILNPNFDAEKKILFDLYCGDADILIICLTRGWLSAFEEDYLPILKKYTNKPLIIFTEDSEIDSVELFDKLVKLGFDHVLIKEFNFMRSPKDLAEAISMLLKRDSIDKLARRKRRLLAKTVKDLDNDVLFDSVEERSEIGREIEDLL